MENLEDRQQEAKESAVAQAVGEDLAGKSLDRPEAPAKDSLGQVLASGAEGLGHHRCFLWAGMGELRHYL